MAGEFAEKFTAWIDDHRAGVLILSVALALLGGYAASLMPIKADLANLLPHTRRSVQDLATLQHRVRPFGTVQIAVEADDAVQCARASTELARRLATLPPRLVAQLSVNDAARYRFAWDHRFVLAGLENLRAARDALIGRIQDAKLRANPLYVSFDDGGPPDPSKDVLAELTRKLADAQRAAESPAPRASRDGRLHLLIVQTTFSGADARNANELISAIQDHIDQVRRQFGPGIEIGLSGNVTYGMHEHDSVLAGMILSAVITVVLCAIALLLYYRTAWLVLVLLWALGVGVSATFALAWIVVGQLNVMTAFLFAIVIGSGINAGLVLVARFLEELRATEDFRIALAAAIAGALRGTLAATLTAGVAYTALLITEFRGFREFGMIACGGMLVTWLTTFTVLPAALCVLARTRRLKPTEPPAIGAALARLLPDRRRRFALATAGVVTAASAIIATAYIAGDPFTQDWRDLQSSAEGIDRARAVDAKIRAAFDQKAMLTGQTYLLAIAVEHRDQVAPLVAKLRASDMQRWVADVHSLEDLIPPDQVEKLVVLREIRGLVDEPVLQASLSEAQRNDLASLRPQADVRPIVAADVPYELAWPFIERDGTRGRLIVVRGAKRFRPFDVADRLEFAMEAANVQLPPGAVIAGESLVLAEIVETMERDAPPMILFAVIGSILAVLLMIGWTRHALVTIVCGVAGLVVMIAACALAGIKVHFLDLIALPITIGIGMDYAVNLAARDRQEGDRGAAHLLRTTGGAVLLCSYTTMVGYGTLLLSANGGIRAFGTAALLGEIACIAIALSVAPAWLAAWRDRDGRA